MASLSEKIVGLIPGPWLSRWLRHAELLKFLSVGAIAFVMTTAIFLGLKWTVLADKPVTANVIAVLLATVASYILNREWAFDARGGRQRHHEALLFFMVAGIGLVINQIPLLISRYVLDLRTPGVSLLVENIADIVAATIIGTLSATGFRWWAMRRFVFLAPIPASPDNVDVTAS